MSPAVPSPVRLVRAAAPVRICDNGGWTDTWFARYGCVFNLAVTPCVEVDVQLVPGDERPAPVLVHAQNFGAPYRHERGGGGGDEGHAASRHGDPRHASVGHGRDGGVRHPLIDATIDAAFDAHPLPPDLACHICIYSDAPPGASIGTSASTTVALFGALMHAAGARAEASVIAAAAHRVETDRLGRQSGIQDQLAAAFGGACFIEMEAYPHARVTPLPLDDDLRWELDARLSLIALGRAHESSAIHERVIAELADRGPEAPPLQILRRAASAARDALIARDLAALGRALADNTEAQAALHADLVSAEARRVIAIARDHGALGWKVNGAGGDGGSITILGGSSRSAIRAMRQAIAADLPSSQLVPMRISMEGLRVWDANEPSAGQHSSPIDIL